MNWFVVRNRKRFGPFRASQLKQMAADGKITPNCLILREGDAKPVRAHKIQGLAFPADASTHAPGQSLRETHPVAKDVARGSSGITENVHASSSPSTSTSPAETNASNPSRPSWLLAGGISISVSMIFVVIWAASSYFWAGPTDRLIAAGDSANQKAAASSSTPIAPPKAYQKSEKAQQAKLEYQTILKSLAVPVPILGKPPAKLDDQATQEILAQQQSVVFSAMSVQQNADQLNAPKTVSFLLPAEFVNVDLHVSMMKVETVDLPEQIEHNSTPIRLNFSGYRKPEYLRLWHREGFERLQEKGIDQGGLLELRCYVDGIENHPSSQLQLKLSPYGLVLRSPSNFHQELAAWLPMKSDIVPQASIDDRTAAQSSNRRQEDPRIAAAWKFTALDDVAIRGFERKDADEVRKYLNNCVVQYFTEGVSHDQLSADYHKQHQEIYRPLFIQHCRSRNLPEFATVSLDDAPPSWHAPDAKMDFSHRFVEQIFYGEFSQIANDKKNLIQAKHGYTDERDAVAIRLFYKDNAYKYLLRAYVAEATKQYGIDQVNGGQGFEITSTSEKKGDWGAIEKEVTGRVIVYVDNRLVDAFRDHYSLVNDGNMLSVIAALTHNEHFAIEMSKVVSDVKKFFAIWPKGSASHQLMMENMARFAEKRISLQEAQRRWENNRYRDEFFRDEVYLTFGDWVNERNHDQTIDGGAVGPEYIGKTFTRSDIARVALDRLIERAANLGIPEDSITVAIIEGKLAIDPRDLKWALEGLFPDDSPEFEDRLEQFTFRDPFFLRKEYLNGIYNMTGIQFRLCERAKLWNGRFGSLKEAVGATSLVNGSSQELSEAMILWKIQEGGY